MNSTYLSVVFVYVKIRISTETITTDIGNEKFLHHAVCATQCPILSIYYSLSKRTCWIEHLASPICHFVLLCHCFGPLYDPILIYHTMQLTLSSNSTEALAESRYAFYRRTRLASISFHNCLELLVYPWRGTIVYSGYMFIARTLKKSFGLFLVSSEQI
ncbi:LANO_0G07492g1_1 [Lachancea nothofagi CBS 11611]|uniref:LANO_0G07492g1_1 n=1 Tax=Lachancea nothofagi CBS 11611 TaxID=1266666 RepID=A0A1G4KHE8_9SACH|nr:LANO_0G07492g1_1 [Lachancea nothofagi CBS 11611]